MRNKTVQLTKSSSLSTSLKAKSRIICDLRTQSIEPVATVLTVTFLASKLDTNFDKACGQGYKTFLAYFMPLLIA
jgi:hypothetical protein